MKKLMCAMVLSSMIAAPAFAGQRGPVSVTTLATTAPEQPIDLAPRAIAKPTSVTIELGGRAVLYSINIDRNFGSHFGLGVGLATWSVWGDSSAYDNVSVILVPVYANLYSGDGGFRPYATVGATLGAIAWDNDAITGAGKHFGGGFELRSESGFLFRATALAFVREKGHSGGPLMPFAGLSFGRAF